MRKVYFLYGTALLSLMLLLIGSMNLPLIEDPENSYIQTVYFDDGNVDYIIALKDSQEVKILDYLSSCRIYRSHESRSEEPNTQFLKNSQGAYLYILIRSGEELIGIHINKSCYATLGSDSTYYYFANATQVVETLKNLIFQE